jgi:hypothetical protein
MVAVIQPLRSPRLGGTAQRLPATSAEGYLDAASCMRCSSVNSLRRS